ncbi:hypothetical protein Adt_16827 [Abeliophyllum distichum]|uniref:Uncharacterized protein n=1 Tax=Abeliophyllum distichum TaxID=126358 RepID=A0ABD1TES3_9LAMI
MIFTIFNSTKSSIRLYTRIPFSLSIFQQAGEQNHWVRRSPQLPLPSLSSSCSPKIISTYRNQSTREVVAIAGTIARRRRRHNREVHNATTLMGSNRTRKWAATGLKSRQMAATKSRPDAQMGRENRDVHNATTLMGSNRVTTSRPEKQWAATGVRSNRLKGPRKMAATKSRPDAQMGSQQPG